MEDNQEVLELGNGYYAVLDTSGGVESSEETAVVVEEDEESTSTIADFPTPKSSRKWFWEKWVESGIF